MVRVIPFIYNASIAYKIELGYKYAKFTLNDVMVCIIATPYSDTDLLQIHYRQIGDTMRLTHSSYPPMKITRDTPSSFSISLVPITSGPFLLRNDLAGDNTTSTAYMLYTGNTVAGSIGNLLCCRSDGTTGVPFFSPKHVGALFQLTTKKTKQSSSWNAVSTVYTIDGVINPRTGDANWHYSVPADMLLFSEYTEVDVFGTFTFTTSNFLSGTNSGTIALERKQGNDDWQKIRIETSSIVYSGTENEKNVKYRARVLPTGEGGSAVAGTIKATVSCATPYWEGIVQITGYNSPSSVSVKVLTKLDSVEGIKKTNRWAEGAWSAYRTYPSSLTFFKDRCIYGGMQTIPTQVVY